MEKVFLSESEEQTQEIAQKLAKITKRGDIWALSGTLGAGKTVFSRAFVQALSDAEEVPSPTFTLLQTYTAPDFDIYHYDLYRVEKPSEIFELDVEEAFYSGVSLVEWPEKMGCFAPRNMFTVTIETVKNHKNKRKITVSCEDEEKNKRLSDVE